MFSSGCADSVYSAPEVIGDVLPSIELSILEVTKALEDLGPKKAYGPDGIPGALLKRLRRKSHHHFTVYLTCPSPWEQFLLYGNVLTLRRF